MKLLQFALIGLGAGAIYAMAAQGIVLVYRGSGILNFASGAMGMIGAQLFYQLKDVDGVDYKVALVVGLGVPALIGVGMQVFVLRPLRHATGLARLIATLGLFAGLVGLGLEIFGSEFKLAVSLLPQDSVDVFGLFREGSGIGEDRFLLLGIAAVLTVVLTVVYRYTTFGLATSAVSENERATAALGRSPNLIAAVNWFLGGLLAGLAAILLAPVAGGPGLLVLDLSLLVIPALAAALIGRFVSFPLTFLGAMLIGVLEAEMSYLGGQPETPAVLRTTGLGKAVPFLVIVVTLVVRGRALPVRGEATAKPPALGTGRVRPLVVVVAVAVALALTWLVLDASWISALIQTIVVAMVCLSLVVVTGYTGQLSIAQFALAGMGGFFAGQVASDWGVSFEVALLIGTLATIPVGLLVALPSLRTRGVNLAVATMGMAVAIEYLILNNTELTTGGGITPGTVVDPPRFFGWPIDVVDHPERYATLCISLLVLVMLMVANLRRGRAGRRMIAVRTNERAAASLGISVFGAKLFAFAFGAAIAALGGVLLAFTTTTIIYSQNYGVQQSINAVVYAVIGGIGFVIGPLFGATFAIGTLGPKLFETVLGRDVANLFQIIGGFGLIAILLQDPDGLASNYLHLGRRMSKRFRLDRLYKAQVQPALPSVEQSRVPARSLEIRDLTVHFGGVVALEDATVTVEPGEVLGLIGPNGAGKTTLIDVATGFVKPRSGHVLLDGVAITTLNARRRARAGMTRSFQSLELFEDMTVRDNLRTASDRRDPLAYLTDLVRPGNPPLSSAAIAAVHEFGLEDDLDRRPGELAFGRRRLVAIARAVATDPSVLFLDEPAAGLDDNETAELGDLIRRLAHDWGIAILLVEHDVGLVLRVCDRIMALDFGRTIAIGTPEEIRTDAAVVAAYLGEPDPAVHEHGVIPTGPRGDGALT